MDRRNCSNKKIYISKIDYTLIWIYIILCGFTSAFMIPAKTYILSILCIVYLFVNPKTKIVPLLSCMCSYILISVIHIYVYDYFDKRAMVDIPLLILSGFYIVTVLGERFRFAYLKVIYYLSLISLVFFFLMIAFDYIPSISLLEKKGYNGLFIYNIRLNEIVDCRNCGPFWEPGAFSGYICMVLVLFFDDLSVLWTQYRREAIVLIIALITTQSTQGYLIFLLIIFFYLIKKNNFKKIVFCLIPFITLLISFLFIQVDFLGDKIVEQWEHTENFNDRSLQTANRLTTTVVDCSIIAEHPFIGATNNIDIHYENFPFILKVIDEEDTYGSGTGITINIATYGIFVFLIWLCFSFLAFRRSFSLKDSILCLIIILLLGNAEVYSNAIFYLSLPFMKIAKCEI